MKRVDLLQDYRRLLYQEQAPVRVAAVTIAFALVAVLAYAVYAIHVSLWADGIKAKHAHLEKGVEAAEKQFEEMKATQQQQQVALENAEAGLVERKRIVRAQEDAAQIATSRITELLTVIAEILPVEARLTRVTFGESRDEPMEIQLEGFGVSPSSVMNVVAQLKGKGILTRLDGLKSKRRKRGVELYFQIACAPALDAGVMSAAERSAP